MAWGGLRVWWWFGLQGLRFVVGGFRWVFLVQSGLGWVWVWDLGFRVGIGSVWDLGFRVGIGSVWG